jgi:regulator of replication initiation timing
MVSRLALDSNLYGAYTIPSTTIVGSPLRASTTLDRTALVSPTVGTTGGYYRLLRDSALPTIVADPQHVSTILDQQAELRRINAEKDRLASEHAFIRASTTGVHEENQKLRQVLAEQAGQVNSAQYEVLAHQAQSQKHEQEKRVVVDVNQSLQQRIASLEQENQRLRGSVVELQARSVDWENLRRSNEVLSADNQNLRKRIDELSVHISDAEGLRNKIVLITQENERVARLYQDRLAEIDSLRKNVVDSEGLRNRIVLLTQENERVARLYQDRLGEIDALRKQFADHSLNVSDYEGLRNRNALLVEENNRLRSDIVSRSAYVHPGYVSGSYPYSTVQHTSDPLWNSGLWGKYLSNNGTTLLTNNQAKI